MIRALPLCLSLLALACVSVARQAELDAKAARWRSIEVESPSDRVVWALTLLALESQGFPPGARDPAAGEVTSGWKTDLQPFRGEGQRRRARVRLQPLEPGRWKVEARVQVELNQNLVSPLDASRAEWEPGPDDEKASQVLLQHVRARLQPELERAPPSPAPRALSS